MPKYYCDYCDIFLTHDSPSVRKAHNTGWKHINQVAAYYRDLEPEKTQEIVDRITEAYGGQFPSLRASAHQRSQYNSSPPPHDGGHYQSRYSSSGGRRGGGGGDRGGSRDFRSSGGRDFRGGSGGGREYRGSSRGPDRNSSYGGRSYPPGPPSGGRGESRPRYSGDSAQYSRGPLPPPPPPPSQLEPALSAAPQTWNN